MTPVWRDYLGRVVHAARQGRTGKDADRAAGEAVWALAQTITVRISDNAIASGPPVDRLAWVMRDTLTIDPARFVRAARSEDA